MVKRIPGGVAVGAALVGAAGVVALSAMVGAGTVPSDHPQSATILWQLRVPRALLACLVGAALSTAGVIFQGLFRNPLADPFVIGVSGGSALGAVALIVANLSAWAPAGALGGGLAAAVLVYGLARSNGRVAVSSLLLSGFAVGSMASAALTVVLVVGTQNWGEVLLWLMGSLNHTDGWMRLRVMAPATLLAVGVAAVFARDLNAMLLGEESAQQLGVEVERAKVMLLVAGSVATAAAVASAGIIGFVGLMVPNLARQLVGPDHRTLLPVSAAGGAFLVAGADLLARTLAPPVELPIGSITALAGAPFFLMVLRRKSGGP